MGVAGAVDRNQRHGPPAGAAGAPSDRKARRGRRGPKPAGAGRVESRTHPRPRAVQRPRARRGRRTGPTRQRAEPGRHPGLHRRVPGRGEPRARPVALGDVSDRRGVRGRGRSGGSARFGRPHPARPRHRAGRAVDRPGRPAARGRDRERAHGAAAGPRPGPARARARRRPTPAGRIRAGRNRGSAAGRRPQPAAARLARGRPRLGPQRRRPAGGAARGRGAAP